MNRIKKRLDKAQGKWVEELPNVLWAYQTTSQKAMKKKPYVLAFKFEAVIPFEVSLFKIHTEAYDVSHNEEVLAWDFDLVNERRKNALI